MFAGNAAPNYARNRYVPFLVNRCQEGNVVGTRGRIGTIVGVLVVASFIIMAGSLHRGRPDELNRSVEVLLSERLGLSYRIVKKTLNPAETDQSGVWWVVLDEKSSQRMDSMGHSDLRPADAEDTAYYRKMINDQLGGVVPIGQSQLLRGEISLGRGSICDELSCNIDLLIHPDGHTIFVSISKS